MPTSLFETFLMMCRSTSALSPVVSMQFSPNYLITMTARIASVHVTGRQLECVDVAPYCHQCEMSHDDL